MPNTYPDTWNAAYEAEPADNENISQGANRIRDFKINIRERVQYNHSFNGDGNDGKHTVAMLMVQSSDPVLDTGDGAIYAKTVGSGTELFYQDSNGNVTQITNGGEVSGTPAGVMMPFGGPAGNVPAGWLLCDGSAVSRTTYARLFNAIGTMNGVGDGTTTFNLPDTRGRVIAGFDGGNATGRLTIAVNAGVPGSAGGEQSHTMAVGELVSHSHSVGDPGHNHAIADPGHTHSFNDPGHTHGVSDPTHTHTTTVNDATHSHNIYGSNQPAGSGGIMQNSTGSSGDALHATTTSTSNIGVAVNPASTGVSVQSGFTGASNLNNTTGVGVDNAVTGIGVNPTGGGSPANVVQPTIVMVHIIKT